MAELPKAARWLLEHFGCSPNNDAVLGDLAEQYLRKHSVMWYWRQAMKAIAVSLFKEIRGHKQIAARALLTGWGMWFLFVTLIFPHRRSCRILRSCAFETCTSRSTPIKNAAGNMR